MLCSSARILFQRNLLISSKQFSRLPKLTYFDFHRHPSHSLLYLRLISDFSSLSSCLHIHRKSRNPKIGSVPCSLRSDHTMASLSEEPQSVHEFTVKDAKGNDVNLSMYKGKVLLIVNVASKCGMTNSNYTELNQLYEKYKDQGLKILAFPCNQFGKEEPGSNDQILEFVCSRFQSQFPLFEKIEVNGENASPLYKFLKSGKWGIIGDDVQWNFAKFLVDKNGQAVDRYYPTTSPLTIERDVQKLLGIL